MILTTNEHISFYDKNNIIKIENGLIFGKYPFNKAKHDHNILVVTTNNYNNIIKEIIEQ